MKPSFKINSKSFQFQDITLRTYYSLKAILAQGESRDAEFEIVHCLTKCPPASLKQLKVADWLLVWGEAVHILGNLTGDADAIKPIIKLGAQEYGLPQIEDLTVGEFADLEVLLSSSNAEDKLADIAAVLYRPVIKRRGPKVVLESYDTDGFAARKELFMDLPIDCIRSANAFFLQSANCLLKNTAESLVKTQKMQSLPQDVQEKLQVILQQDPGGELSTSLHLKIPFNLGQHPSSQYAKHLTGLAGKRTRFVDTIWPFRRKQNTK